MSTFAFSDEPQTLRIFNYAADTQEFIGVSDAYIAPPTPAYRNAVPLSNRPNARAALP